VGNGAAWPWMAAGVCGCTLVTGMQAFEYEDLLSFGRGSFAVQPQLDVASFYTDNLFYGGSGNRVSDLGAVFSPGVRFQYGNDLGNQISLQYAHDEFLYLDNSQANTSQDRIDFTLRYSKSKTKLEGKSSVYFLSGFLGGAINTLGRVIDQEQIRNEYKVTWDATANTDFYVEGDHNSQDFKSDIGILDVRNISGTLGGSFKYSDRLRFFAEGFYGQSAVGSNTPGQLDPPDSEFFGGFVGVRGEFSSKLFGSAKVGYEQRVFSSGIAQSANTPAVMVDMTYQAGPKTSLLLRYDRRTSPAPQIPLQTQVGDSITFRVNQGLGGSGRWLLIGNARYSTFELSDLFRSLGNEQVNLARTDKSMRAGLALVFQPRMWAQFSLAYDYERFSVGYSDPRAAQVFRILGYDANRVTLSMSFGY
jgi:hypothetical protein